MVEILKIDNLTKKFKLSAKQRKINKTTDTYKVALNGLHLNAYKGEIYGLLGPNGAGKTTTLRIICTLIKKDQGTILFDGINLDDKPALIREKIGFLTSELKLDDFFTPNYLCDYFGALHHMKKEEIKERKDFLFNKFGIDKFKEVKIGNLSNGMKQKVALVVSLIHDPEIIIFDEPTNGLDVIASKIVIDYLMELKAAGKTIIISTHIFSLVEKICDRIGIIFDGQMAIEDSLANLTKNETLEELFFRLYEEKGGDLNA